MINIEVEVPEIGSVTVTSVPVLLLKLLLYQFSQTFEANYCQNIVVCRYQVPEFCGYRSTVKGLHMRNENHRIYGEFLRDSLQPKNGFSFWLHFPRARDTHIDWKSNTASVVNVAAETKEEDSKIQDKTHRPGIETSELILDNESCSLFEHPTKAVEAGSDDMPTYLDIPDYHRTGSYDIVT